MLIVAIMILISLLPQDIGILRQRKYQENAESFQDSFKHNHGLKRRQKNIKDSGKMANRKHRSSFKVSFLCNRADQLTCVDKTVDEAASNLQTSKHTDLLAYYDQIEMKTHDVKENTNINIHVEHQIKSQLSSEVDCITLSNVDIHQEMSTDL